MGFEMPPVLLSGQTTRRFSKSPHAVYNTVLGKDNPPFARTPFDPRFSARPWRINMAR